MFMKKHDKDFIECLKKSKLGDAQSQVQMANYYELGFMVEKDIYKAVYWWERAANQGVLWAQYTLGNFYMNDMLSYYTSEDLYKNKELTKKDYDYDKGIYWYTRAAEGGLLSAQRKLGDYYIGSYGTPKNISDAIYWYKKASEQGSVECQFNLGTIYYNGNGVKKDVEQAIYWWENSSAEGHIASQFGLALCYYTKKDINKLIYWITKAAENEHTKAQSVLGSMYSSGEHVEQDLIKAAYWWEKAANSGDPSSQYYLGMFYELEKNDISIAIDWYNKAAAQNFIAARDKLIKINENKNK